MWRGWVSAHPQRDNKMDLIKIAGILAAKAQTDAPNYRAASTQARCATCVHFDGQTCDLFNFQADQDYICDRHEARNPMQEMRALIEQAGARHSRGDNSMLQLIHDNAVKLGAMCDGNK